MMSLLTRKKVLMLFGIILLFFVSFLPKLATADSGGGDASNSIKELAIKSITGSKAGDSGNNNLKELVNSAVCGVVKLARKLDISLAAALLLCIIVIVVLCRMTLIFITISIILTIYFGADTLMVKFGVTADRMISTKNCKE